MQSIIRDIILSISNDVVNNLPQSFEKTYYGKMNYSGKNAILDIDNKLLKKTIGFEIAFVHVITYFLAYSIKDSKKYTYILNNMDTDNLFSWYKISDNTLMIQLSECAISLQDGIYELINEHDKFIEKNVKKKIGQFYTPKGIAQKMVFEIKDELKALSENDLVVDPACGTGVFVVETVKQMSGFLKFDKLLRFVEKNIFAYDVNPFSVIATKMNLLNMLLEIASDDVQKDLILINMPKLKNIKWKNTIVDKDDSKFSIILGNPPYFKLDSKALKDIDEYDSVIYGQPNIYSLFTHWGISHLCIDGTMSFIVPQSIRSGLYFKNLREEMKDLRIKSILHITSRQNVFDRAEQAVLVICLKNKPVYNTKTKIQYIDGNQNVLSEFSISRSKLMMGRNNNYTFIINKKPEMYEILEKVYNNGTILSADESLVKFSNGLFVWNQHKTALVDVPDEAIPIVYGGDIQPMKFHFITTWNNHERKSFAKITDKTRSYILSGKRLLVQRTTNFEKDIRLKACLISDDFLEKYDNYYLENHVNYLCSNLGKEKMIGNELLKYYLGLLNSRLINYVFISKCGNTQVSANELNLLPFSKKNIKDISAFVSEHLLDLSEHQEELDRLVCEAYDLSANETNVIIDY
ncbi:MAG: SAM-dependent methyltransferase [Lachnospiraceae bacterium]|nr:SAM-dependent methyltransferase [Lachnospiraceae bacterium]